MKRTLAALAALLVSASSLVCAPARAQQPASPPARATAPARTGAASVRPASVYRVELIVFRATSALGAAEDWAAEAGTSPVTSTDADPGSAGPNGTEATPAAASSAQAASAAPTAAQASGAGPGGTQASSAQASGAPGGPVLATLPESEFELGGIASRLRASGRYMPVAHIAWTQTASPWEKPVEIPVQSVGLNAEGITGTVALERGVYLHLVLDLRYAMSDPPAGLDAPPGTVFVLDQSQRVRLKERNYFDHPAFGVIALVTSNQPPKQPPSRSRE
jgi:Peptidoglycan-binding protein, CsiV